MEPHDACQPRHRTATHRFRDWWQTYRAPILAAVAVNLLAFGYLFFTYIYSNHLFPNMQDMGYPTFRTSLEGRWGADLIYQLQGGRAIPLLNLMLAVPVQIANGIMFARLFNLRDGWSTFLAASLISIHPFVSDYYAFAGDHLPLVVGDGLILLAFHTVRQYQPSLWTIPVAAFLIQAGLSCYQPKIGLVATLWVLVLLARVAAWDGSTQTQRQNTREMLLHGTGILSGVALYMAMLTSIQWWMGNPESVNSDSEKRLAIIDPSLILLQARKVLGYTYEALFSSDLFGATFRMLPGLLLLLMVVLIVVGILRRKTRIRIRLLALTTLALALALLPFAVHAPFLVSENAYLWGRLLMPVAYVSAFLPLMLLMLRRTGTARLAVLAIALFMCYRFILVNAEAGHLAQLRSIYEFQFVNRVLTRIEQKIDPTANQPYALVVVGRLPLPDLLLPSAQTRSNLNSRGFIHYREVQMLNFMMARQSLAFPNREQTQRALEYAAEHAVWPAEESVAVLDGRIVVVLFEPPHSHVETTMTVP